MRLVRFKKKEECVKNPAAAAISPELDQPQH